MATSASGTAAKMPNGVRCSAEPANVRQPQIDTDRLGWRRRGSVGLGLVEMLESRIDNDRCNMSGSRSGSRDSKDIC